jgi:hypothetical protein
MAQSSHRLLAFTLLLAMPIVFAVQTPAQAAAHELSLEQQTKMADAITREAGARLPSGRFSLVVGDTVPADVPLRPLPASLDTVAPDLRGASYVVVEEQIAIVDSNTRKILTVIQRGLRQSGSAPAKTQ